MQEEQSKLSVTFEIIPADMRAFQRHARRMMPEVRRIKWIMIILPAVIAFHLVAVEWASDILQVRIVVFLIIFGGGWLFMAVSSRLMDWLVMAVRPNHSGLNGILCEHTLTIDPEGLTEVTPVNEGRHYWKGVHRVDSTPEHILIYIQPAMAHIIPRRAFASPEQADLFFRAAAGYHQAAVRQP